MKSKMYCAFLPTLENKLQEEVKNQKCQCGEKVSFGCNDQCRLCYYTNKFQSKSILAHLTEAGVPSKTARRVLRMTQDSTENKKVASSIPIPETFKQSLFLPGKAGIGKTTFAVSSMLYHMEQYNTVKEHLNPRATFLFETSPQLIQNLQKSFKLSAGEEQAIMDRYKNVDFLILDDFGVEKPTEWAFTVMYLILTHRYEEDKQTIFTSNFSINQIARRYGDERLTRRIKEWCKIIELS